MQLLFPDRIELPETECRCSVEIFEVLTHRMLIERLEQESIGPFFLNDSVCFLIQFNPLIVVHFYTGFLDQFGSFVVIEYIPPAELFGLIIGKRLSIGVGIDIVRAPPGQYQLMLLSAVFWPELSGYQLVSLTLMPTLLRELWRTCATSGYGVWSP